MNKNKTLWYLILMSALCIFAYYIHILEMSSISENEFYMIVDYLTKGYQIKQIAVIYILFIYGTLISISYKRGMSQIPILCFSVPVAISIYCLTTHLILLLGIKYNSISIVFILCVILCWRMWKIWPKKSEYISKCKSLIPTAILFLGVVAVATSGVLPIYMSGDSYHYVAEFGWLVGKLGAYDQSSMAVPFTRTALSPAIISSMGVLWGFEATYGIHHAMMFSMLCFFIMMVYTKYKEKQYDVFDEMSERKKFLIFVAAPIISLLSCEAFITLTSWIISTAYWMVYSTFLCILLYEKYCNGKKEIPNSLLLLFSMMITITRAEGIMFVVIICVCMTAYNVRRDDVLLILVSNVVLEFMYLAKVFLAWKYFQSELMSPINGVIVAGICIGAVIYIFLAYKIPPRRSGEIIAVSFLTLGIIICVFKSGQFKTNLLVTLKNLGLNEWGLIPYVVLLLMIVKQRMPGRTDLMSVLWMSQFLMAFFMNCVRYVPLRLGIGDSFNRLVISLLPMIFYSFIVYFGDWKNYYSRNDF